VPVRFLLLVLAFALVATACVPQTDESSVTVTNEDSTSTTDTSPGTTTTIAPADLVAPERGDPDETAADAFWDAGGFDLADEPDLFDEDALTSIELWLPEDLVDGLSWEVFVNGSTRNVLAVSVIPTLTWRGDPNFVPALISTFSDTDADEIEEGIFRTETVGGLVLFAWSTGDGFVISTSTDADLAIDYLKALEDESEPQTVWKSGTCLYTDPDSETLPYAPFPPDVEVPCDGPHNAEVLHSAQVGIDLDQFDEDVIDYERNYQCDRAYTDVFGSQKTHTPSLITYMPDADEWDRGDRYLACVVQIDSLGSLELTAGPMADRSDLDWSPDVEACLDRSFAPEAVDCGRAHGYQYLGDATVAFDMWPDEGTDGFQDACSELLRDFARQGPATVDVFATGLSPYAFELGDRTVQCMAFATEDNALVDVAGSFAEIWRVVGSDGVAA
jgi:hypothetical protein